MVLKPLENDEIKYKNLFHYYVKSGIPLVVGMSGKDKRGCEIGNSMVCIGHEKKKADLRNINKNIDGVPYIDTASYCGKYVIMDDNQKPYTMDFAYPYPMYVKNLCLGGVMKVYSNPVIVSEPSDNFMYSVENIDSIIDELQEKVDFKLRENEKRETVSIIHATQFITTIQ